MLAETILVATLGAEPQVVTLALDYLLSQNTPVSRVVVVHTLPDREPIRSSLTTLNHEFLEIKSYGSTIIYTRHLLSGPSGPLEDVSSAGQIDDAFHSLYTLLRHHKHAGDTIHLCIAGGRKTMALFAMAAAQILFDADDRVWHLVSDPSLIKSRQLHAFRPGESALIAVPVAHWGRIRSDNAQRAHLFIRDMLTPAEREVVVLLIREGLSNSGLADRLGKSVKTIANQLSSVYIKLADYFELDSPPDRTSLLVLLGSYS
ncbi:MAG: hypothetical protein GX573_27850 [Chloroflexi bacterium]|nr:hypothetical protein [Chloroflexota bacterium]